MAGIAGFINGVFQGMEWREGREDRARVRKMQDEEFGWRREDQEWQREDRRYTRSERERVRKEREAELAAWGETADELFGAGGATPVPENTATAPLRPEDVYVGGGNLSFSTKSAEAPATQPAPNGTRPRPRPALSVGEVVAPQPQAMTSAPVLGQPEATVQPTYRTTDGQPYSLGMSLSEAVASLGPDAVGYRMGQIDPRLARAAGVNQPAPPPAAPVNAPAAAPVATAPAAPAVAPAYDFASGLGSEMGILPQPVAGKRPVQGPPVQFTGPAMPPNPDTGELPPPSIGGPIPALPEGMQPSPKIARPNTSPTTPPVAAAPKTPQGTPMASVQLVSETPLSFGLVGENGVVKTTPQRVERTVKAAEADYQRTRVPAIVEHYIRTGQPEKAEAFEKWISERGVREGMRAWQKSILAVQANDGEGFIESLADAYEAPNYYDDGLSVVRDKSSVNYDESGNIIGASVTFKDDETGREFTQNFSDIEDFVASAIGVMAPESAFDKAWEMTFGEKQQDNDPRMSLKDAMAAVANFEAENVMAGKPMTAEEKAQMVEDLMDGRNPFVGFAGSASGVGSGFTVY